MKRILLIALITSASLITYGYPKIDVLGKDAAKYIKSAVRMIEVGNLVAARNITNQVLVAGDSYDKAVAYNYLAFIAFAEDNYEEASYYYEMLLQEPGATLPIREAAIFTLGQLLLVEYEKNQMINPFIEMVENEFIKQGPTNRLCLNFVKLSSTAQIDFNDYSFYQACPVFGEIPKTTPAKMKYPKKAQQDGLMGKVTLFMRVNNQGKPYDIEYVDGDCSYEIQDGQFKNIISCTDFMKVSLKAAKELSFENNHNNTSRGVFHQFSYILE